MVRGLTNPGEDRNVLLGKPSHGSPGGVAGGFILHEDLSPSLLERMSESLPEDDNVEVWCSGGEQPKADSKAGATSGIFKMKLSIFLGSDKNFKTFIAHLIFGQIQLPGAVLMTI